MNEPRGSWLADRRATVRATFDAEAPTYDDETDYPVPLQPVFVRRLVETCPPDGIVLDAPCGTGRWFPIVTDVGRRVVGIDQSAGMLAKARARGLDAAFSDAQARGWPSVHGEVVEGDTAGYHYYPGRERVLAWLAAEGLGVIDEAFDQHEGWGYRHLLLRA